MNPTILFLFNHSHYAMLPWLQSERYNVVTVDYEDTDHSRHHLMQTHGYGFFRFNIDLSRTDAKQAVDNNLSALGFRSPSIVISFAPCTDLAVSGAAHFERKRQADPDFQTKAVRMARLAEQWGVPYAVENPVSVLSTLWRKPDFTFHPCDFAKYCPDGPHPEFPGVIPEKDRYNKKTCLWTGNGFILPQKSGLPALAHDNPGHVKLGGKSARTKYIRSLTPRGFAMAVYLHNFDAVDRGTN